MKNYLGCIKVTAICLDYYTQDMLVKSAGKRNVVHPIGHKDEHDP
jgi:hypothetical protein